MNFFRRLFLVLFGLILILVGTFVLTCEINDTVLPYWIDLAANYNITHSLTVALTTSAIIIIIGAFVLFLGFYSKKADPLAEILVNDFGPVNISLSAVDNIIKTTAMKVNGILGVKTRLKALPSGLTVQILVTADQAVNIPEVTCDLQKAVKENLEVMVGIKVAEVKVLVSAVSLKPAARQ